MMIYNITLISQVRTGVLLVRFSLMDVGTGLGCTRVRAEASSDHRRGWRELLAGLSAGVAQEDCFSYYGIQCPYALDAW
jgi:hypothetical protein